MQPKWKYVRYPQSSSNQIALPPPQGPAVWALRAQTDKLEYARAMRTLLEGTPNLELREGMATDLELDSNDQV